MLRASSGKPGAIAVVEILRGNAVSQVPVRFGTPAMSAPTDVRASAYAQAANILELWAVEYAPEDVRGGAAYVGANHEAILRSEALSHLSSPKLVLSCGSVKQWWAIAYGNLAVAADSRPNYVSGFVCEIESRDAAIRAAVQEILKKSALPESLGIYFGLFSTQTGEGAAPMCQWANSPTGTAVETSAEFDCGDMGGIGRLVGR